MAKKEYDFEYLGQKAWFRLLNVVTGIVSAIVLLFAYLACKGTDSYTYYPQVWNPLTMSYQQSQFLTVVPAVPFQWSVFWQICVWATAIIGGLWMAVVYTVAGSKAKKTVE